MFFFLVGITETISSYTCTFTDYRTVNCPCMAIIIIIDIDHIDSVIVHYNCCIPARQPHVVYRMYCQGDTVGPRDHVQVQLYMYKNRIILIRYQNHINVPYVQRALECNL